MNFFVSEASIVRKIWGKGDTILFIFAGAAAEFALNKAVDWLYFTGRLPADPLNRLFSTVTYARHIVFATEESANKTIDNMTFIHKGVEKARAASIPDEAYRDVLYMLIDYSIRSYELLERKLSLKEKEEVFEVFIRVGRRMELKALPYTYQEWLLSREEHMSSNLIYTHFTEDLFDQYRIHLGWFRFVLLRELQMKLVPAKVQSLLGFRHYNTISPLIRIYYCSRLIKMDKFLRSLLMPKKFKSQIEALDHSCQE